MHDSKAKLKYECTDTDFLRLRTPPSEPISFSAVLPPVNESMREIANWLILRRRSVYCSSTENNKVNFFDGIRQKGCIMKLGKTQSTGAVQNVAKGVEVESCRRREDRYFPSPVKSDKLKYFSKPFIRSLLALLKVTWQLINYAYEYSVMADWFHDHSLSIAKYYTSLSKSLVSTNCYHINKEINILHYNA